MPIGSVGKTHAARSTHSSRFHQPFGRHGGVADRARAQQPERMRRIGVLTPYPADEPEGHARLTAFAQALQQSGWAVGQNVQIDYRWGDGKPATMRKYAAELIALAPDVVLASSSAALAPLLDATRTVPIVFAGVGDPVGAGYVESLARPGGNVTGVARLSESLCNRTCNCRTRSSCGRKRASSARARSYNRFIATLRNLTVPSPNCSANGPSVCRPLRTLAVCLPSNVMERSRPLAVISIMLHLPPALGIGLTSA